MLLFVPAAELECSVRFLTWHVVNLAGKASGHYEVVREAMAREREMRRSSEAKKEFEEKVEAGSLSQGTTDAQSVS